MGTWNFSKATAMQGSCCASTAGCGLCWAMPFSGDALAAFCAATEGRITPADYHQLVL